LTPHTSRRNAWPLPLDVCSNRTRSFGLRLLTPPNRPLRATADWFACRSSSLPVVQRVLLSHNDLLYDRCAMLLDRVQSVPSHRPRALGPSRSTTTTARGIGQRFIHRILLAAFLRTAAHAAVNGDSAMTSSTTRLSRAQCSGACTGDKWYAKTKMRISDRSSRQRRGQSFRSREPRS